MEQHGGAHRARAARGSRLRARLGTARRKRRGWLLGCTSKRAAQVVLGIGVTAREAGAAELQHGPPIRRSGDGVVAILPRKPGTNLPSGFR
jgi:hypothetical protein